MKSSSTHLPSLLGALLFLSGAVIVLGVAVFIAVVILGNLLTGAQVQVRETILLAVTGFEGLLLLGAAYVSIQKFLGQPSADKETAFTITGWQVAGCLLIAGTAIAIGHWILTKETVNWLLLPLLTLPAVLLPILVLLGLAIRGVPLGPRWRTWNVLGISMTLVPFITFVLEAIAIAFIFILVIIFVLSQPDLMAQLERLSQQIYLIETDPEALMELLAPLMLRPGVLAIMLLFFSILVPLLEELVKPLGVWLFANQISSPAQGFALGALGGFAFALVETLGVSPQSEEWSVLLLTRLGTDILHVTTSAWMGAGIVYAIRERRYLRLAGTYLLCVLLHGLWNGMAILFTFSNLADLYSGQSPLNGLAIPAGSGLALLAAVLLMTLVVTNRRMRATQIQRLPDEVVP